MNGRESGGSSASDGMHELTVCTVCGGDRFQHDAVLWQDLISEWRLSPDEVTYVDRQQGTHCIKCGANLRSMVLAQAICAHLGHRPPLADILPNIPSDLKLLEINEAGTLSPMLEKVRGHLRSTYPETDMQSLPYGDATFDIVVHSDTLEHVERPIRALAECRRVLKPDGACCFTVPIIVGRMTTSREGLKPSYHGAPGTAREDFIVHTEYGADAWTHCVRAGFNRITFDIIDYPAAIAITASNKT